MTKVFLDRSASSKLEHLSGQAELCDETDRSLGVFLARGISEKELYAWAQTEFTDEELDIARKEPGGLTIGQVLEGLTE